MITQNFWDMWGSHIDIEGQKNWGHIGTNIDMHEQIEVHVP